MLKDREYINGVYADRIIEYMQNAELLNQPITDVKDYIERYLLIAYLDGKEDEMGHSRR